ncbi:unnamed protein product [Knipowitschia caucasica]|uniref:Periphilin-1 C-terminal domain-containing protein n=1 Tax=Knipowitschia caucasica TaxID=637954 RepID=A0AAV2LWY2_KNICA
MDHSPLGRPQMAKRSDISGGAAQAVERPIRRVQSPSRGRAGQSYSYNHKMSRKFQKFYREDQIGRKSFFRNNRKNTKFKPKPYNRRQNYKPPAPVDRVLEERYEEKSREDSSPSKPNRVFPSRSSSSRDKDQSSGPKSDKSQSRERDQRGPRSRDPDTHQSAAKQAARERAIQKKRKEIDEVYFKDCEMFGLVVKMLIEKDPSLEIPIQESLRQNLRDIGARCVQAMEKFIEDYDSREKSL